MASDKTVIVPPVDWEYVPTLVAAARIAAGQVPLPSTQATRIIFQADKDNTVRIFITTDKLAGGEGIPILGEENHTDEGNPGAARSLRDWYAKGDGAAKLEVIMQY